MVMPGPASVVFLLSALFVLYVLAGYPLLLLILSRRPQAVNAAPVEPMVTVLLAVHNGERWIAKKISNLAGARLSSRPFANFDPVRWIDGRHGRGRAFLRRPKNRSYGAAARR